MALLYVVIGLAGGAFWWWLVRMSGITGMSSGVEGVRIVVM